MAKKTAVKRMIGLLLIVSLFHLLVLLQVIPYDIVWAGKIRSREEMYVFEAISLLVNVFLIAVLFVKERNLKEKKTNKFIDAIIWTFVFLFALNTLGNLFAESIIEQVLGTFLTFVLSLLCWLIVRKPEPNKR